MTVTVRGSDLYRGWRRRDVSENLTPFRLHREGADNPVARPAHSDGLRERDSIGGWNSPSIEPEVE